MKPRVLPTTVKAGKKRQHTEYLAKQMHVIAAIDRLLCWDPTPDAFLDLKPVYDRLNAWTKAKCGRGIKQGVVPALLSQVYGIEIPKQTNYCSFCTVSPCTRANCGDHFDRVKAKRPRCHRVLGLGFI